MKFLSRKETEVISYKKYYLFNKIGFNFSYFFVWEKMFS